MILAHRGLSPIIVDRNERVGGKMASVAVDGSWMDGGPTVLTMLEVFEDLFSECGMSLHEWVTVEPARVLARHFWDDGSRLDLFSNSEASFESIRDFAGLNEAEGFIRFQRYTAKIYDAVEDVFIHGQRPTLMGAFCKVGLGGVFRLWNADVRRSMHCAIRDYFSDPRLIQLFGRYATYAGNDPFRTPATFNLIAHVEQRGVWRVVGGMGRLADALAAQIEAKGGEIRCGEIVERIEKGPPWRVVTKDKTYLTQTVVFNGDIAALTSARLGNDVSGAAKSYPKTSRSLSALTWCGRVCVGKVPLLHHNIFFSPNYEEEFDQLTTQRNVPVDPTVYVCAQDRGDTDEPMDKERLLVLVNAPAVGDDRVVDIQDRQQEIIRCQHATFLRLQRAGLNNLNAAEFSRTSPVEWETRFPGSGGAIYGRASRHWTSVLNRSGARSRLPGLYLVGGSVHPGAGVPMAALSGRMAAQAISEDFPLTSKSHQGDTYGGTLTH